MKWVTTSSYLQNKMQIDKNEHTLHLLTWFFTVLEFRPRALAASRLMCNMQQTLNHYWDARLSSIGLDVSCRALFSLTDTSVCMHAPDAAASTAHFLSLGLGMADRLIIFICCCVHLLCSNLVVLSGLAMEQGCVARYITGVWG